MATTQKIRNDIAKTKEKIAEQQKRLRALEAQLAEEENLEIVRMVKAVKMDNKELTAFLKAYASGMISLPKLMDEEEVRLLILSIRNSLRRCKTKVSGSAYFCTKSLVTIVL